MTPTSGYMGFLGVSTSSSSIMDVFPLWAEVLGLPTNRLVGHDIPLNAPDATYIEAVESIRRDPNHRGALVTTHKMNIFRAASHLFDDIDEFARACGEVSSISKRDGKLVARAKDPVTVALALNDFLPADYFRNTGAEVLILGAGGSGTALSWALADRTSDSPTAVTVTARRTEQLEHLRDIHQARKTDPGLINYVETATIDDASQLVNDLPPGSLVVNATGLGKDRPGSPLTDEVSFPIDGIAWEFNYRGSLEFLAQAREQHLSKNLTVVDGWRYFIHGWSQVIADVFSLTLTEALVDELARVAETVRASS
jgi:shikimate dehydrogenase